MLKTKLNVCVGIFLVLGIGMVFFLAIKVSNFSSYTGTNIFNVTAIFDNVGDLKGRAPITISGVRVGEVGKIILDKETYRAMVELKIEKNFNHLPKDTTAKILTAGIIGANYVELIPGYEEMCLKDGDIITDTQPAIIIENLISKFLYSIGNKDRKSN